MAVLEQEPKRHFFWTDRSNERDTGYQLNDQEKFQCVVQDT